MADISIRHTPDIYQPDIYQKDDARRAVPGTSRGWLRLRERAHALSLRVALIEELGGLTERERQDAGLPPKPGLHWTEQIALLFMQR